MALSVKKGTFTLATTDSGTKQIRGVGFQGKALRAWCGRAGSDNSWSAHAAMSIGFATEDEQCGVHTLDQDGIGTSANGHVSDSTFLLRGFAAGGNPPTTDWQLSAASTLFVSDGFDLVVDDAPSTNIIVHYVVYGGTDITDVEIGSVTTDYTQFPVNVTVRSGFGQPDLLFFASANDLVNQQRAVISVGFAKSDTERFQAGYYQGSGETTMDCGTAFAERALTIWRGTTTPTIEFSFDLDVKANWPTDGFRAVLAESTGSAAQSAVFFYLAFRGTFQSKLAVASAPTSAGDQDLDAGFPPVAETFLTDSLPTGAASPNLSHADVGGLAMGDYDGTDQGVVAFHQDDGNTNSVAKNFSHASRALQLSAPGSPPVSRGSAVASHPSGNTVRLAWTAPDATARRYGWMSLGSAAGGTSHSKTPSDALGITDSVAISRGLVVADGLGVVDVRSLGQGKTVTDNLGITDSSAPSIVKSVGVNDSLGISDARSFVLGFNRQVSDGLGLTDVFARQSVYLRSLPDSLGLSDSVLRSQGHVRSLSDGLSVIDVPSVAAVFLRVIPDLLGLTDEFILDTSLQVQVSDLLGVTDSLARQAAFSRPVSDALGMTDTQAFARSALIADGFILTDQSDPVKLIPLSLSDLLGVTDSLSPFVSHFQEIADALTVADQRAIARTMTLSDLLVLDDGTSLTAIYSRTLADLIGIDDEISPAIVPPLPPLYFPLVVVELTRNSRTQSVVGKAIVRGVTPGTRVQSNYQSVTEEP